MIRRRSKSGLCVSPGAWQPAPTWYQPAAVRRSRRGAAGTTQYGNSRCDWTKEAPGCRVSQSANEGPSRPRRAEDQNHNATSEGRDFDGHSQTASCVTSRGGTAGRGPPPPPPLRIWTVRDLDVHSRTGNWTVGQCWTVGCGQRELAVILAGRWPSPPPPLSRSAAETTDPDR